jgi:nicotinamidase/pyrazinamidase
MQAALYRAAVRARKCAIPDETVDVKGAVMETITLNATDALLLVDVQNDFLPGGKLAVAGGDEVIPVLNRYIALFQGAALPVFATRDWHPADHCSFSARGGIWPAHCIAGSEGAAFPAALQLPACAIVVSKATTPQADAYSGFQETDLAAQLHGLKSERLFIGGLATDYCVLNTVNDALKHGFKAVLLLDAIRAVNLAPDDGKNAIEQMVRCGARIADLSRVASNKNAPGGARPFNW